MGYVASPFGVYDMSLSTLAAIDHLLDRATDAEIAVALKVQGHRTFVELPFRAVIRRAILY